MDLENLTFWLKKKCALFFLPINMIPLKKGLTLPKQILKLKARVTVFQFTQTARHISNTLVLNFVFLVLLSIRFVPAAQAGVSTMAWHLPTPWGAAPGVTTASPRTLIINT